MSLADNELSLLFTANSCNYTPLHPVTARSLPLCNADRFPASTAVPLFGIECRQYDGFQEADGRGAWTRRLNWRCAKHVFLISFDPLTTNVVLVSLQKHNSPTHVAEPHRRQEQFAIVFQLRAVRGAAAMVHLVHLALWPRSDT